MNHRNTILAAAAAFSVCLLPGCLEKIRDQIPLLPQSKYIIRNGRKMTREEAAYYQKLRDLASATRANPKDAVAYNQLGELLMKKGSYDLARRCYLDAIDRDDSISEAHHNLGVIYIYSDRFLGAVDELVKAKRLSPDDAKIRHHLAVARIGLGEPNEAMKELDEAIALDPEYTPAHLEKAKLLYQGKKFAEAEKVCRAAIASVPKELPADKAKEKRGGALTNLGVDIPFISTPGVADEEPRKTFKEEAQFDLALCLRAQGKYQEALAALVLAEPAEAGAADVHILRARLQNDSGDTKAAISTLEELRLRFKEMSEIPKRLAAYYEKTGDHERAIKTRLEAAELDHSDRRLQEEAVADARAKKDPAREIAIFERLVRVDPDDLKYRRAVAKAYDDAGLQRQAALAYQEVVTRAPDDDATRRRMAVLFSTLPGFQGRATLHIKKLLEKNPADVELQRRQGELYLQSRNFIEAEKHIRETLHYAPNDPHAHQNLATLFAGQNRQEDAIAEYKKALQIDPSLAVAQLNLAKVLLRQNLREEALKPLRDYLAKHPLEEEPRQLLAGALRDLGKREEAIQEYEAIAALRPDDPLAMLELGALQEGLGKPRASIGLYESILEKNPSDVRALREAGRLYIEMNMHYRAIYCWQRVLSLKPGDMEAQRRLAEVYKQTGSEDSAIKQFEKVAADGDGEAWRDAALLHLKNNRKDKAIADLQKFVKAKPQDIEGIRLLASMLVETGGAAEKQKSIELYRDILKIAPKDGRARLNLANLLCDANQMALAQEEFDALLRNEPKNAAGHLGLGVVLRKGRKYQQAIEEYRKAAEADPTMAVAHYNMGLVYDFYLNDRIRAQEAYQAYVRLGGDPAKVPNQNAPVENGNKAAAKP